MKKLSIEERDLLLKDLCARLQYGVKVGMGVEIDANNPYTLLGINPTACGCAEIYVMRRGITCDGSLNTVKPYLRPMSSMTGKEKAEYKRLCVNAAICNDYPQVDYLISNHFDYRGLIPMGLALPATEDMYNIK